MSETIYPVTFEQAVQLVERGIRSYERAVMGDAVPSSRRLVQDWLADTAITAALGDGALVVSRERLRAALMQAWDAGECYMGVGVDPEPILAGEGGPDVDRIIAALTAPEVEG